MWPTTSSHERGYGAAWRKRRAFVLQRDRYLCQCSECKRLRRIRPAHEVDHIIPRAAAIKIGWTEERMESSANLQAINRDCHKLKTMVDSGYVVRTRIGADGFAITERWGLGGV